MSRFSLPELPSNNKPRIYGDLKQKAKEQPALYSWLFDPTNTKVLMSEETDELPKKSKLDNLNSLLSEVQHFNTNFKNSGYTTLKTNNEHLTPIPEKNDMDIDNPSDVNPETNEFTNID